MTRLCFGTTEYNSVNSMCKNCPDTKECAKVKPKKYRKRKKIGKPEW